VTAGAIDKVAAAFSLPSTVAGRFAVGARPAFFARVD